MFLLCSSYAHPMLILCSSYVPPMFLLNYNTKINMKEAFFSQGQGQTQPKPDARFESIKAKYTQPPGSNSKSPIKTTTAAATPSPSFELYDNHHPKEPSSYSTPLKLKEFPQQAKSSQISELLSIKQRIKESQYRQPQYETDRSHAQRSFNRQVKPTRSPLIRKTKQYPDRESKENLLLLPKSTLSKQNTTPTSANNSSLMPESRREELQALHAERVATSNCQKQKNQKSMQDIQSILANIRATLHSDSRR